MINRYLSIYPCMLIGLLFAFLSGLPALSIAQEDTPDRRVEQENYYQSLNQLDVRLEQAELNDEQLKQITNEILNAEKFVQVCINETEATLKRQTESLEGISSNSMPEEEDALNKLRTRLETEKQQTQDLLAQCKLLAIRATEILGKARKKQQTITKERLLVTNDSIVTHVLRALQEPERLQEEGLQIIQALTQLPINKKNLALAGGYGLTAFLLGLMWALHKRQQYKHRDAEKPYTSPTLAAVSRYLIRIMPLLLLFGIMSLCFYYFPPGISALSTATNSLFFFSLSYAILSAMLHQDNHVSGFNPLLPEVSHKLLFWARYLLFTILLGVLFQEPIFDEGNSNSLISLIRILLGTLVGLALMRLLWLLSRPIQLVKKYRLHWLGVLVTSIALGALWLGYPNSVVFLFTGLFGTLFVLLISGLLFRIPIEIFDGMDEGRVAWQQNMRHKMGLSEQQVVPGLIWLRLVHAVTVIVLGSIAFLFLWGVTEQSFQIMLIRFMNGYEIGDYTLKPMRILMGLSLITLLIGCTYFFKRSLTKSWLRRTNLSRGAREATTTITGYIGVLVSILIGLHVAGIQFSNLAIVAGALSVGIGFGLQNIVNNFVSGLILLFERPIRRGDWIKVGNNTEGYVKDISIRSTTIESFDRYDIIVPNSEFISGQVVNMMLHNQHGRIVIPIQVAYGTDTQQILDILQEAGENHPATLRETNDLQVTALFRRFGEGVLHFELRCVIRDVENILKVTSELNMAIEKSLREADIQLPLPPRALYFPEGQPVLHPSAHQ